MLTQKIYWEAPIWQILLASLLFLGFWFYLIWIYIKKPSITTALIDIDESLNADPLLFFSLTKGIVFLNSSGKKLIQKQDIWHDVRLGELLDIFNNSLDENRLFIARDLSVSGKVLLSIPMCNPRVNQKGILGIVIDDSRTQDLSQKNDSVIMIESPPNKKDEFSIPLETDVSNWLYLGRRIQLHKVRSLVKVKRDNSWQENEISFLERRLLESLAQGKNEVQTTETLFAAIWDDEPVNEYGLHPAQGERLRRLVYQLRQNIEPDPKKPYYLVTVRGVGYIFHSDVELNNGE